MTTRQRAGLPVRGLMAAGLLVLSLDAEASPFAAGLAGVGRDHRHAPTLSAEKKGSSQGKKKPATPAPGTGKSNPQPAPQGQQGGSGGQGPGSQPQAPGSQQQAPQSHPASPSSSPQPAPAPGSPSSGGAPEPGHQQPGAAPQGGGAQPAHGAPPSPGATPTPPQAHHEDARPPSGPRPQGYTRGYDSGARTPPPASARDDHRYTRPEPHHVRPVPAAGHPPPHPGWYRPYYTRWYVHPYYRCVVATYVVVSFGFEVYPWTVAWAPPPRVGWTWMPGYWAPGGWWVPGYWVPVAPAPAWYPGYSYAYVPGYWQGTVYVDGYYRLESRSGWTWVDGYYMADGNYVPGHWQPTTAAPEGYEWEPGFFDGKEWQEGFWRPTFRNGYTWVSAWFDADGIYHSGYWKPTTDKPGSVWVPGWFDGTRWVEGYWVTQQDYDSADAQHWTPPEGWDDGQNGTADAATEQADDGPPLAVPVSEDSTQK